MKKRILTLSTAFLFVLVSVSVTSCGESKPAKEEVKTETEATTPEVESTEAEETAVYQCPMKCEGEKTYAEAGSCPECKMDLEKLAENNQHDEADHNHDGHDHQH